MNLQYHTYFQNIINFVDDHGFDGVDCGIATDDVDDLSEKLAKAIEIGDVVVTTGGVSMGDRDLLRQVILEVSY